MTVLPLRKVTVSAWSRARQKFSHRAFIELTNVLLEDLVPRTWQGFRLYAIDSSTAMLPSSPEVIDYFGCATGQGDRAVPMGRISLVHDVLNHLTVDASLKSYHTSEIRLAFDQLNNLGDLSQCLFLLDRGYNSFPLAKWIVQHGGHFCFRLRANLNLCSHLKKSGQALQLTSFKCGHYKAKKLCRDLQLPLDPIPVWVVRIDRGKRPYFLATSLTQLPKGVSPLDLQLLYQLRWFVEESFRQKKCRLSIENFTGKNVEAVYQDFHAKVFSENLAMWLLQPLEERLDIVYPNRNHTYRINRSEAFSKLKDTIVLLFYRSRITHLLRALDKLLIRCLSVVRPGRASPRRRKGRNFPRIQHNNPAYRPL